MAKIIAALLWGATACDVWYDFGDLADTVATKMEATLTWYQVENLDHAAIYMATGTGTACNSGYFGAQFHKGGKTTLLFSMWDAPSFQQNPQFVFQSLPGSPHCHRNALDSSGKSTGTQCAPNLAGEEVHLEIGVPYTFSFEIVAQNASGAMWEASMFDPKRSATTSIGKIFFVDSPMGLPTACRTLGKSQNPPTSGLSAYTFMENFAQPRDYLSVGSWADMKISSSWHEGHSGVTMNYDKLGNGGCAAQSQPHGTMQHGVASDAACRRLCSADNSCGAYDFCSGSNCKGNCNLWPSGVVYDHVNGYPTVECYTKSAVLRPTGIKGECCDHGDYKHGDRINGSSSTCSPPDCDSPEITFKMGPYLTISDKILKENPGCLGNTYMLRKSGGTNCWRDRIPNSIEECIQAAPSAVVV